MVKYNKSFHLKMGKRDKMFDIIEVAARDSIEKAEAEPLVAHMMDLHETADKARLRNSFAYMQLGFLKLFMVYGQTNFMLKDIYEEVGLSKGLSGSRSKSFLSDVAFTKYLAKATERMKKEFVPEVQPKSGIDELREKYGGVPNIAIKNDSRDSVRKVERAENNINDDFGEI